MTSVSSKSIATTFLRHLNLRDGVCMVTHSPDSLQATHLIPKRMGTDGAKDVVRRFVGEQAANGIHRFHPGIGVLLLRTLNSLAEDYQLGLYHVTVRNMI